MLIKDTKKIIMRKFSVKGTKIKSWNFFSLFSIVNNFKLLNERPGIVNSPKPIIVIVKFALFVKVFDLSKDEFKCIDTILLIGFVLHLAEETINLALDGV